MSEKLAVLVKSRRFWVCVAGVVVTTTNIFGLDLNPDQIQNIVLLGGAWVVGDSLRTT